MVQDAPEAPAATSRRRIGWRRLRRERSDKPPRTEPVLDWAPLEVGDRSAALRAWADEGNRRVLLPVLWIATATAFGVGMAALEGPKPGWALAPFVLFGLNLLCIHLLRRRRPVFSTPEPPLLDRLAYGLKRSFRIVAILYPLLLALLLTAVFWGNDPTPFFLFVPFVIVFLRLPASDRWLVHLGLATAAFLERWGSGEFLGDFGMGVLVVNAGLLGFGLWRGRRSRRGFLSQWVVAQERSREEQRMRQELESARSVQLSMLPSEAPALSWLEMARLSLPAAEVGGDYYDFFPLDEDRMLVVIGDVAGHGLASGLVLASIRTGLTLLVDELDDPPRVMQRLHRMLRETSRTRVLVSLALVVIERRGRITVTSAGHPPALLWRAASETVELLELPALPLGTAIDSDLVPASVPLDPGDTVLLYTDGLFEASDSSGEPLGLDELAEAFGAAAGEPLEDLKRSILRRVSTHRGAAAQEDDITLVAMRFDPHEPEVSHSGP